MEIRSYRRVFDLERRIYRVDRLRLNRRRTRAGGRLLPGDPGRGSDRRAAAAAGERRELLPWYLGDLALPAASAALLTMIRVEGRPFHMAARALLRYRTGLVDSPAHVAAPVRESAGGLRTSSCCRTAQDSRMRRSATPGRRRPRVSRARASPSRAGAARRWTLRGLPGEGVLNRAQVIALAPGARLMVRSDAGPRG